MSVAEWANTSGIHHWRIFWSSYRKLVWIWFEPKTSEFHSDALNDWSIWPWVQLELRANFVQLFQFPCLFSVTFYFGCLSLSVATLSLIKVFCRKSHGCSGMSDTYGIHHWGIRWSSYRKFAWMLFEPKTTEFRWDVLTEWAMGPSLQLELRANFVELLQFHRLFSVTFHFGCLPSLVATIILIEVFCR